MSSTWLSPKALSSSASDRSDRRQIRRLQGEHRRQQADDQSHRHFRSPRRGGPNGQRPGIAGDATTWFTVIAWISLVAGVRLRGMRSCFDIYARGNYQQKMWIMEAVWPVTALYFGPLAWFAYARWGRQNGARPSRPTTASRLGRDRRGPLRRRLHARRHRRGLARLRPRLDLVGLALPAEYVADFALAFALGIVFQYFSIAPMRGLGLRDGLRARSRPTRSR